MKVLQYALAQMTLFYLWMLCVSRSRAWTYNVGFLFWNFRTTRLDVLSGTAD